MKKHETLELEIIFWIKIISGSLLGILYYFYMRFWFSFLSLGNILVLALSIPFLILAYFLVSHLFIIFIVILIKNRAKMGIFSDKSVWKYSLEHFLLFFAVLIISSSIMYYINV
jgi:hypothetical protein